MATATYILGVFTTLLCAVLLLRAYAHSRQRLLLWSGLCFCGLCLSNTILFIDLVLLPSTINLYLLRLFTAAIAMLVLVYGLIWESE
ncbi:MAG: DUF5985 family protein [Steroidobacteraceae bacterium]